MSSNQKSFKFKCDRCDKRFKEKSSVTKHVNSLHLGIKFNCEICSLQFTEKGSLKIHINAVHFKLKRFQCDECDQSFGRSYSLKIHVDAVHRKIRFHCTFDGCDKSFTFKNNLSTHFKLHEGQVNLCDQCGKTFTTKGNLHNHKKQVHSDTRLFQCTTDGCDKSFKLKSSLRDI